MMPRRGVVRLAGVALLIGVAGLAIAWLRDTDPVLYTVTIGQGPVAIAVDDRSGRAFIANRDSNTISVLDSGRGRVVRTVSLGSDPSVSPNLALPLEPGALAVDAPTGRVFITSLTSGVVGVLDRAERRVVWIGRLRGVPQMLAAARRTRHLLIVTEAPSRNMVTMLDARTGRTLRSVLLDVQSGDHSPGIIVLDERSERAFISSPRLNSDRVSVLDLRTGAHLRTIRLGYHPTAAAVDERTGRAFVAGSGQATMLDATTGAILRISRIGATPQAIAVDQQTQRVFVVDGGQFDRMGNPIGHGSVSVLDARSGALLHSVSAGVFPTAAAVVAGEARVIVVNGGSVDATGNTIIPGSVSILDAHDGTALRTIPVGNNPMAIAVDERLRRAFVVTTGSTAQPNRWGWVPRWVWRWLPSGARQSDGADSGHVVALDTSRL